MATTTRSASSEVPNKWRDDEDSSSPDDRTKIWKLEATSPRRRVAVVYYLSRNGNLEHPHFMEITLSSSQGLFLRDFINRLNQLRGKGIASIYSWSSKRSYKNGYVWHDLAENDFIYPSHGTEYVLKGSELLDVSPDETPPFQSPKSTDSQKPTTFHANPRAVSCRRRNQSMSAIELDRYNYKVYKAESTTRSRAAADASTQTYDDQRRQAEEEEEEIQEVQSSSTETSPPPVDSSPETLQTMLKTHGRLRLSAGGATELDGPSQLPLPGGRLRASSILMQMISCGAVSFKDCGVSLKGQGLSMVANSKVRVRRGAGNHPPLGTSADLSGHARARLEDKEYFSGSLVETKKEVVPVLKRSSSYNMDRSFDSKIDRPIWNEVNAKARAIRTKKKPAS